MNPIGRYGSVWSRPGPPGVFTPAMFRPGAPIALQVHRRVLTGYPSGRLAPAVWPASVWRGGRWLTAGAGSQPDEGLQQRFAEITGVPVERQDSRLAALAAVGVRTKDAYRFGLLQDGAKDRWMQYVYDHENGWNIAAGGLVTSGSVASLSDKYATAQRLHAAGVPVVNSEWTPRGTVVSDVVLRRWLGDSGEVFLKPNVGTRGDGSFVLRGPDPSITPYQDQELVPDPVAYAQERISECDYLRQPLLRNTPMFDAVADPIDVVTVRVVTRDVGSGPRLFSTVLEVPLPPDDGRQKYAHLIVQPDGVLGPRPLPPWCSAPEPGTPTARIHDVLTGQLLPDHDTITTEALAGHRQFPGVFAIAWDVAITPDGPVFLEGNGGFGTSVPQMVSGGLLVGLEHLR